MTLTVLAAKVSEPGRIDASHSEMFHGRIDRIGFAQASFNEHFFDDNATDPLQVTHNVFGLPLAFKPGINLIVADQLAKQLSKMPSVRTVAVVFSKLFYYPYQAGDFSCCREFDMPDDFWSFNDFFQDDPTLHRQVGEYFEIVVPSHNRIEEAYQDLTAIVPQHRTTAIQRRLSSRLLTTCDISVIGPDLLLTERARELLAGYLHPDYFFQAPVEISAAQDA